MSRNLQSFKYRGEKFADITDFSELIELLFDNLDYESGIDYNCYEEYYLCFNPFIDGKNKSATIYYKDGNLLMYNSALEVIRQGQKVTARSITITEYHRMLGHLDDYIDFVLLKFNINPLVFNQYKRELPKFLMKDSSFQIDWRLYNAMKEFRRFLFKFYIVDKDVLYSGKRNVRATIKKRFRKPLPKEQKPKPKIGKEIGIFDKKIIERYIEGRKILLQDNAYPANVEFNGGSYCNLGLCFEYPSKFKKVRFVGKNSKMRYIANSNDGEYVDFFEAQKNYETTECYLVEGEIEGLTIKQYTNNDVYCMHNTNSLPSENLYQLEKYDTIIVLVDYDKFKDVEPMIKKRLSEELKEKTIIVRPKVVCSDKKVDFNSLHIQGKLNNDFLKEIKILDF